MPRGIKSEKSRRREGQKARWIWQDFLQGKIKVYDEAGHEFIEEPDEIFVDMYMVYTNPKKKDPKAKKAGDINKQYKVSNKGHIISLKNGRITLMTPTMDKESGYMLVGESWKVHRAVWFSFAADAIKKKHDCRDLPEMYGMAKEVREIKNMRNLKKLLDMDLEVDHRDDNRSNNRLDNLELVTSEINTLFIRMKMAKTDEERMKILSALPEPTIVDPGLKDGVHGIAYADHVQLSEMAQADLRDLLLLMGAVESEYTAHPEKFSEVRYGWLQSGNDVKAFRVKINDTGNVIPELLLDTNLPDGVEPTMTFDISMPGKIFID